MTSDAIFRIASQPKALTSVVILSLMEEERLRLDDPAGRYIPTFARTTVAVANGTEVTTAPARRMITIKDLLTHTAGVSSPEDARVAALYKATHLGAVTGRGWYTADKDEPICDTMERLGTLPFVAQPGEAWVYGYNTDILGSNAGTNGRIFRAPDRPLGQGNYVDGPRRSFAGGAGLLSTARDCARFLEMIRRGGDLDGTPTAASASVSASRRPIAPAPTASTASALQ